MLDVSDTSGGNGGINVHFGVPSSVTRFRV